MRHAPLAAAWAALASACACAPPTSSGDAAPANAVSDVVFDAETELAAPVVVPLLGNRLPIVEATIDGTHTARFLVDSALEITLLDAGFARRARLEERPFAIEFLVDTAGGKLERLDRVAVVDRLSIGAAVAKRLMPPLAELAEIEPRVDGILGQDVIGDWALFFHAKEQELVILPSEGLTKSLAAFLPAGTPLESIAVHGDDRIPCITLAIHDAELEVELHVDTGSTHTTLPERALAALGVGEGTPSSAVTLSGREELRAWKVADFPLGTQHVPVHVQSGKTVNGLLGYDALSQRAFVLDGPGKRLLVEATNAPR